MTDDGGDLGLAIVVVAFLALPVAAQAMVAAVAIVATAALVKKVVDTVAPILSEQASNIIAQATPKPTPKPTPTATPESKPTVKPEVKTPTSHPGDFTRLRGNQGLKDRSGNKWKIDQKHKDHWDVSNRNGQKIREYDFSGRQIWPNGPKNKNKK